MEKIYIKTGYTLKQEDRPDKFITREIVVLSIQKQTAMQNSININLQQMQADLEAIDNAVD